MATHVIVLEISLKTANANLMVVLDEQSEDDEKSLGFILWGH